MRPRRTAGVTGASGASGVGVKVGNRKMGLSAQLTADQLTAEKSSKIMRVERVKGDEIFVLVNVMGHLLKA
jgi:hypothetical protein